VVHFLDSMHVSAITLVKDSSLVVMIAFVDFPNLRGVDVIEEARQRILSTFRAYTTGLLLEQCHS